MRSSNECIFRIQFAVGNFSNFRCLWVSVRSRLAQPIRRRSESIFCSHSTLSQLQIETSPERPLGGNNHHCKDEKWRGRSTLPSATSNASLEEFSRRLTDGISLRYLRAV
ncbi:MAG: hypothetical protein CMJ74_08580 [Planctomycetaceae bacterium]|nr:hypothetical protein [Planctomycetaceae bacterium]